MRKHSIEWHSVAPSMGCESSLQKQKVLNQLFCVWKNCVKHNQPSVMHWVYICVEVEAIVVSAKFDLGLQACIPSPAVKLQACRCRAGTKLKYQLLCKIWKRLRSMLLPRSCSIVGWSNCFQGVQWSPCCMDCFFSTFYLHCVHSKRLPREVTL